MCADQHSLRSGALDLLGERGGMRRIKSNVAEPAMPTPSLRATCRNGSESTVVQ